MISIHLCKQLIFILVPLHSKEKNTFSIMMSTHSYNSLGPPWKLKDFLNHPGGVPHMWAAITHHMTHFFPPIVRQHEIMCTSTSVLLPQAWGEWFPRQDLAASTAGATWWAIHLYRAMSLIHPGTSRLLARLPHIHLCYSWNLKGGRDHRRFKNRKDAQGHQCTFNTSRRLMVTSQRPADEIQYIEW